MHHGDVCYTKTHMIQILVIALLAGVVIVIAAITGGLGWLWLLLFQQELNLPFGAKKPQQPKNNP